MDDWLIAAVVVVPLLAGLSLIGVLARGIFNNPAVANSNAALLAVAGLLCIAPTLVNLAVTLPNGTYQADVIPHAILHEILGEGHWLLYEHFGDILRDLHP